jgi:hypothetical protein
MIFSNLCFPVLVNSLALVRNATIPSARHEQNLSVADVGIANGLRFDRLQ